MQESRDEDPSKTYGSHFHNIVPGFYHNVVGIKLFSQNILVMEAVFQFNIIFLAGTSELY